MSGNGRIALASSSRPVTLTEISPVRVVITVLRSDPVAAIEGLDVGERDVADDRLGDEQLDLVSAVGDGEEDELPVSRLSITRPPIDTAVSVSSPGPRSAPSARTSAALWVRSKRYGYGWRPAAQVVDLLLAAGALGGEPAPGDRRPVFLVGFDHAARRYRVRSR